MNHICECNPDSNGNPTSDYALTCQGKVNAKKMTLKDDNEICTCKKQYISISEEEKIRLEAVWMNSGHEFIWLWNEDDSCYYPVFN